MRNLVIVMLGGAIGAGFRYQVGLVARRVVATAFPWSTLFVNLLGGLCAGILAALLTAKGAEGESLRLFLGVGLLGGFTTFSAFSAETVQLLQRGEAGLAGSYILGSVAGSILLCFIGFVAGRAAS
jgi:CrcB protein